MKEITVTYTLEVTKILRHVEDGVKESVNSPEYMEECKTVAENVLGADDVNLSDFKVFVHDEE